jgi:hypothetical protein
MDPMLWRRIEAFFRIQLGLSSDLLLASLGLLVMLATAVLFRRSLRSLYPWLAVVALVVGMSLWDLKQDIDKRGRWRWHNAAHDAALVLTWPTLIWLVARRFKSQSDE